MELILLSVAVLLGSWIATRLDFDDETDRDLPEEKIKSAIRTSIAFR